jgi:hypothetical protein
MKKKDRKMEWYLIVRGRGNDEVVPDQNDLDLYRTGAITWKGFVLNYETKLRGWEAYEWMRRVSEEAAQEDVVLVSDEENAKAGYRSFLAEMMASMFGGKMNFRYMGELSR